MKTMRSNTYSTKSTISIANIHIIHVLKLKSSGDIIIPVVPNTIWEKLNPVTSDTPAYIDKITKNKTK